MRHGTSAAAPHRFHGKRDWRALRAYEPEAAELVNKQHQSGLLVQDAIHYLAGLLPCSGGLPKLGILMKGAKEQIGV